MTASPDNCGDYDCRVISHSSITEDVFRLRLESPEIAAHSAPGQFVQLRVTGGIDPLLRRPFSIHRVHRDGWFELLYRVVGIGTERMSLARPGDSFRIMGPLGRGFAIDRPFREALIVAGGMGSAPVIFLIEELVDTGRRVTFLWGARNSNEFFDLDHLEQLGVTIHFSTDDGSRGCKGLVTDLLTTIPESQKEESAIMGFACGPEPMLKCIQEKVLEKSIEWQASLEKRMACGIGVCQGCAVRILGGNYRMTCSDGPVFDLKKVVFDD